MNYKGYAKPDASEKQLLNYQSYRVSKSLHSVFLFAFVLLFLMADNLHSDIVESIKSQHEIHNHTPKCRRLK